MRRPCLTCGALVNGASYCVRHRPQTFNFRKRTSGGRAATFRRRTLAQTGGRCAVPHCRTPWDRVQAHHLGERDEDGGVALCHTHHVKAEAG